MASYHEISLRGVDGARSQGTRATRDITGCVTCTEQTVRLFPIIRTQDFRPVCEELPRFHRRWDPAVGFEELSKSPVWDCSSTK
jgi:hypothetical protein